MRSRATRGRGLLLVGEALGQRRAQLVDDVGQPVVGRGAAVGDRVRPVGDAPSRCRPVRPSSSAAEVPSGLGRHVGQRALEVGAVAGPEASTPSTRHWMRVTPCSSSAAENRSSTRRSTRASQNPSGLSAMPPRVTRASPARRATRLSRRTPAGRAASRSSSSTSPTSSTSAMPSTPEDRRARDRDRQRPQRRGDERRDAAGGRVQAEDLALQPDRRDAREQRAARGLGRSDERREDQPADPEHDRAEAVQREDHHGHRRRGRPARRR